MTDPKRPTTGAVSEPEEWPEPEADGPSGFRVIRPDDGHFEDGEPYDRGLPRSPRSAWVDDAAPGISAEAIILWVAAALFVVLIAVGGIMLWRSPAPDGVIHVIPTEEGP